MDIRMWNCGYGAFFSLPKRPPSTIPPGTKPIHAEKNPEELIFAYVHVGPVFALVRIQENIFKDFLKYVFALWPSHFGPCPLH